MSAGKGRRKNSARPPASANRWRRERRTWCDEGSNDRCDGTNCGSAPVDVPATGKPEYQEAALLVGFASVFAETDRDGRPGVHLYVSGPISEGDTREGWVSLRPQEARELAAEILAHADLAESE